MKRKLLALALCAAFAFTASMPLALAASSSPNSCFLYQSTSNTSSDGSMTVKAFAYTCASNTSSQVEWYASSGRTYTTSGTLTICGTGQSLTNVNDFQGGQAVYSTVCYGEYSYDFSLNTLGSYSFTAHSGSVTVDEYAWSGNCPGSSSTCVASTSASAP